MIVVWTVTFYSQRVEEEILTLPAGILARFIRYAERMEAYGPDLGMPHTRAMGGGIFELRIKAARGNREGVLLHCGGPPSGVPPPVREENGQDAV